MLHEKVSLTRSVNNNSGYNHVHDVDGHHYHNHDITVTIVFL